MEIKAYYNSCLHRGVQLKSSGSNGSSPNLRCPFHGFTWSLDGEIKEIPCKWDFPHIKEEKFSLPEIKLELWGGFVFINMDPDAKPLAEYLGPLAEHFKNWPLENRYIELHIEKKLPCNWKAAQEAFLEAYHVLETHPEGLPTAGDANAQYDVFSEHVTRFVHTIGFPSPHWKKPMSEQDILDALGGAMNGLKVPEGGKARAVQAQHLRETLGKEYSVELSNISDSEMLDSIEYYLFPNMFLFPGISLPMIYRFRPDGNSPDNCIFDLLFLRPLAPGAKAPDAPLPYKLDVHESYTTVPGINLGLGAVYDQDTGNLQQQQRGFKASRKGAQTLGNYQEIRARRLQMTIDKYLNA
jgi:nitrite reductase/ring-hydroxylating ferredoxin subunit